MWFRKRAVKTGLYAALAALAAFGIWACHLEAEEGAFLDVTADSSWTGFDSIKVVLADSDGKSLDTLFNGPLKDVDQLKHLQADDFDGGKVQIILVGYDGDTIVKSEIRHYDGETQSNTEPNTVVVTPIDTAKLEIQPNVLKLYKGGPKGQLAPSGAAWAGKTLAWTTSDASVATVAGGEVTPLRAGKAWISAEAPNKSKDSSEVTVVVDAPVIDAGPDTAVPLNASLSLKAYVAQEFGVVAAFKWSLDGDSAWDDSAAGLPAAKTSFTLPERQYPVAGVYVLRFYVRDGEGNEAVAKRSLTVSSQIPKITSLEKDWDISTGDSVAFSGKAEVNAGALKKFTWNYGDGTPEATGSLSGASATVNGGHRFAKAGTFKVTLSIEDDAGTPVSASVTVKATAKAVPKPPIANAGKDTSVLAGTVAHLRGSASDSDGTIAKYEWSIDGAAFAKTAGGDTDFVPAAEGQIRCILRATDNDGLTDEDTLFVTASKVVLKAPLADAGKDTSVLINTPAKLHGSATDADGTIAKYEWSIGGAAFVKTSSDTTFTPSAAGAVRCILRATDNDGLSDEDTLIVTVTKPAQKPPAADAGKDTSVQVNTKANLHGSATDADGSITKLEWSIGGAGFVAGPGDTSIIPVAVGSLRCILRATDNDGLTDLDTVDLTVTKTPPPVISAFTPAADTTISINDSVPFTLKIAGSVPLKSYSWDFTGDGTADETGTLVSANATLKTGRRYAAAGTYTVTFKVTDEGGEVQTRQVNVVVETDPPVANAGADTTVAAGTRVNLHGKVSDKLGKIVSTEWRIGAAVNFVAAVPESGFIAPGSGGVSINCLLRATDDDGLSDTDTVVVAVKKAVDANLSGLTLTPATALSPAFAPATLAYTGSLVEATASVTLTATAPGAGATIKVNGVTVASGSPSAAIAQGVGKNSPITIVVTAQDTSVKKTYTVTLTRVDATPPVAPTVTGSTPATTNKPTWTWTSGGGGNLNFRYRLDNSDLTTGATATTALTYTPPSGLTDGTHTLYVQETDTAGNWSASGKFAIVVQLGPVSWYKFDGTYADAGPNANTGVPSGSPAFVADASGAAGKAIAFNDLNAVINTGTAPMGVGNTFSVTLWVKLSSNTTLQYFVRTGGGGIGIASDGGSIAFAISTPSTNSASAVVTPGVWTHIVGTYDGTSIKLYKNGVLQATTSHPGTNSGNGNLSDTVLGFFNNDYWDGAMDDLRFYPRILTPAEITAIAGGTM